MKFRWDTKKFQSKISRLPAYLTIQFVRFFYKEKGAINAKILKDVKFPMDFDAFDLCTSELQKKLMPMREKFKELEDSQVEESRVVKDKRAKGDGKEEEKKNVRQEQFWFDNGNFNWKIYFNRRNKQLSKTYIRSWIFKILWF